MIVKTRGMAVIIFLFIMSALSSPVCAETSAEAKKDITEIERVEVTGSRLAEDINDVPASAYVITRLDIEKSGARDTQEALALIPGVTGLVNGAAMAQSKGITIRGLNSEVLLLVDGAPFMGGSYGVGPQLGSPFDLRSIDLASIERIEVVKGASSAIYGSNAAGGVINIITRKGAEKSSASIKLEGGTNGWFRGAVRGTAVMSDDLRVTVGYTRTQETGDVKIRLVDPAANKYDHATDYRGNDYVLRIEKGYWSLAGEFGDYESEWNYTGFGGKVEKDRQKNDYKRFSIGYADGTNTARAYYHESNRDIFDGSGRTEYSDSTIGLTYNRRQELGGFPFVWGIDWKREHADYSNHDNPWGNSNPYDVTRNGFAPYVEASIPVGKAAFDIGLRYEYWNIEDGENIGEFVPRFSLNYEDMDGRLWYVTAGRYFSMPSFYQMFGSIPFMLAANPELKPEKGWTYDIGVKNMKAEHPWSFGVFYMDMKDKINYKSDPVTWMGQYVNVDEYRAWGIEGQIRFNINDELSYTQGLSWTKAEEKLEGGDWKRSSQPRWDVSGTFDYAKGPWLAQLSMHYYGDRVIDNKKYNSDDIFIVNASVAWKSERSTLRLSCTNLFDREYYISNSGYINPERRISASWEYTF